MNPLAEDLDHVLSRTRGIWEELRGRRIFITGGTGFFGCWLLESFAWANDALELDASALVLTRDPDSFRRKAPHLANLRCIEFLTGDVRSFDFPSGEFTHLIHAATETTATSNKDPLFLFDSIVEGTRRTLEFASKCGARKFLLASSGAVYGRQPPELSHISEGHRGGPDPADSRSEYGEGKRAAEMLCALYARRFELQPKIARCFAFVGPCLALNAHFAIGNFIRDGLNGGPILVNGDGTPYRSYLYAADLAIWLWTILFRGEPCRPYNVGSEDGVTIRELAEAVARAFPGREVRIAAQARTGVPAERYVPSTERARLELGLETTIDLVRSIEKTIDWHRNRQQNAK